MAIGINQSSGLEPPPGGAKVFNHTYFPESGMFVAGSQTGFVPGAMTLLARSRKTDAKFDKKGEMTENWKWDTHVISPQVQRAVLQARSIRENYHRTGVLSAADESLSGDFLAPLIQIRLHQMIMGEMKKWFHLDNAFNSKQVDQLLYRMPFQDNPAAAQMVPSRQQYDINKVAYHESLIELEKAVTSYDIAWEDKLRATIDFEPSLQANLNFSIDYLRETKAAEEVKKIAGDSKGKWYDISTGNFTSSATAPSGDSKVLIPAKLDSSGIHSKQRSADEIQLAMNAFTKANDTFIDTAICSPKTGMRLAANTWTENNTIFNVEAYRTNGGVRPFPGIPGVQMVMSLLIPDNRIYFVSKMNNVLMLAEGPKQMKSWDDPTRFRMIHATADFFKYKFMPEDFGTDMKRDFAFAMVVDNATS